MGEWTDGLMIDMSNLGETQGKKKRVPVGVVSCLDLSCPGYAMLCCACSGGRPGQSGPSSGQSKSRLAPVCQMTGPALSSAGPDTLVVASFFAEPVFLNVTLQV